MDEISHILFLGQVGFPCGYAEVQKVRLIAKSLLHANCKISVINRLWVLGICPENINPQIRGTFEGINYIFAPGTPNRPKMFLSRTIRRILIPFNEAKILFTLCREGKISGAIVSIGIFWQIFLYKMFSIIFSFPIIMISEELRSAIVPGKSIWRRLDAWLYDRYAFRFVDGVLPISEFLVDNIKKCFPDKPYLKVPVLVDRSRYDGMVRNPEKIYLLFCGSLAYLELIEFILRTFDRCHTRDNVFLYLVVNGSNQLFRQLQDCVSRSSKRDRIEIYSRLTDKELALLYINAYALFIPLRPTHRDSARFPHKIGEYCASGRPVITTNYGEIRSYFIHGETAFIANEYSEESYAGVIEEAFSDPQRADRIGANGKILAEREFDHIIHGSNIKEFIISMAAHQKYTLQSDTKCN